MELSREQDKILKICTALHEKYGNDFAGWVEDFIDFTGLGHQGLTDQQKEIGYGLVEHKNFCVSSGGGTGKSACAALLTLWFLSTHPHAKVPTTAPSGKQLKDVLWSEIHTWLNRCKLKPIFDLQSEYLYIKGFKEWYATARTVPRDGRQLNDTLAGFHAPHLLIIVDEASGVPDPVFTALDGAMTKANAMILLISNPVSSGGYYYDTISDPEGKGKNFKVVFFDSRRSPLVDPSFEERIINRYGKDSPMYKAKVLGLPIGGDDSVVVTAELYDEVTRNNREVMTGRCILAVDVSRGGEDQTIFCHRIGNSIVLWEYFKTNDTNMVVDKVISIYQSRYLGKDFCAIIDAIGIGAGVYDNLVKKNMFPVIGFIGSEKAFHEEMYDSKRSEGYDKLKKSFADLHFPYPPPKELKKELVNIRYDFSKEKIALEPKKRLIGRIGFSPDHADALMLSCIVDSFSVRCQNGYIPKSSRSLFLSLMKPQRHDTIYGKFTRFVH